MESRFWIALVFGLIVTGLSLMAAWDTGGRVYYLTYERIRTDFALQAIDEKVNAYRMKHGVLPRSLKQAGFVETDNGSNSSAVDGWRHPFAYSVRGNQYFIVSYGRDGKPGGVGIDYDLSNVKPHPPEAFMTFPQFLAQPGYERMIGVCFISGILTFFIGWNIIKPKDSDKPASLKTDAKVLVIKLAAILLPTLFITFIMIQLHVPSGH